MRGAATRKGRPRETCASFGPAVRKPAGGVEGSSANTFKLLTPGPLTTTITVKGQMLFDHCAWDDDYKKITQEARTELVRIGHCSPDTYTAVLMRGSGTFDDESVLTSVIGNDEKALICSNGAYGKPTGMLKVDHVRHQGGRGRGHVLRGRRGGQLRHGALRGRVRCA